MAASMLALSKANPQTQELASLAEKESSVEIFADAYLLVNSDYRDLGATDKVAKGPDLLSILKLHIQERLEAENKIGGDSQ